MKKDVTKSDGWANVLTGLNMKNRDKKMSTNAVYNRLSQFEVESIYAVDKLAKKIVNKPVVEAFRKDPIFSATNVDEAFNQDVHDLLDLHGFWPKFIQAAKWARLYGAGFLLFGVRDGRFPNEPVDFNSIRSIDWIQPLHRHELNYSQIERDVAKPFYREPVLYNLDHTGHSADEAVGFQVHRSRLIRIDGERLPDEIYKLNGYYHDSVLNAVQNALRNYSASHDSAASLLEDFAQGVFKIKGLGQLIAAGKDDQVLKRLQLIDTQRSVVRGIVLDSEEEFKREVTTLTGLRELLEQMGDRLVGESEMPHTILLGEGSTGNLSGAGESEATQWYEFLKGLQKDDYKPAIMEALKLFLSAKNTKFKGAPVGLDTEFPSLEEMNEKEIAQTNEIQAKADQIYIQNQVLSPDEVALSRFGSGERSLDTQIDVESRRSLGESEEVEEIEPSEADKVKAEIEGNADVQKQALNGAQVTSMVEIVLEFKQGNLDRSSAAAMLQTAFNIDLATAEKVLGSDKKIEPVLDPKVDNADHVHYFEDNETVKTIKTDGGHYHELVVEGEVLRTDEAPDTALHTHNIPEINRKTDIAVEIKADELSDRDLTPPASAIAAAKKVLKWREEHGEEVSGMTSVGWARARQLASGKPVGIDVVKKISQFKRHKKNASIKPALKETPWKDSGHVAWLGWGGDEAILEWAPRVVEKAKKAKE